jgi:hypothetical protein
MAEHANPMQKFQDFLDSTRKKAAWIEVAYKQSGKGTAQQFHQIVAERMEKVHGIPASPGWVRDQCRENPMSDPSFLKTCALNISLEELFPTRKEESDEENA